MRLILILIPIVVCLIIIATGDFYVTHILRKRVHAINQAAQKSGIRKLITWKNVIALSALLWIIPLTLMSNTTNLEYRILITLSYWLIIVISLREYLIRKTIPKKIIREAFLYLLLPSISLGVIVVQTLVFFQDTY